MEPSGGISKRQEPEHLSLSALRSINAPPPTIHRTESRKKTLQLQSSSPQFFQKSHCLTCMMMLPNPSVRISNDEQVYVLELRRGSQCRTGQQRRQKRQAERGTHCKEYNFGPIKFSAQKMNDFIQFISRWPLQLPSSSNNAFFSKLIVALP